MVLIGSDGHEARLREGKGAEVPVRVQVAVGGRVHVDHVEARLVAMHGVQYHLEHRKSQRRDVSMCSFGLFFVLLSKVKGKERWTDVPVVVQQVVGELEGVEGDGLLHPLGAAGGRVRVEMHPARGDDIRPTRHQPGRAVERVPGRTHTHTQRSG